MTGKILASLGAHAIDYTADVHFLTRTDLMLQRTGRTNGRLQHLPQRLHDD
jgi:hypothetical protein